MQTHFHPYFCIKTGGTPNTCFCLVVLCCFPINKLNCLHPFFSICYLLFIIVADRKKGSKGKNGNRKRERERDRGKREFQFAGSSNQQAIFPHICCSVDDSTMKDYHHFRFFIISTAILLPSKVQPLMSSTLGELSNYSILALIIASTS